MPVSKFLIYELTVATFCFLFFLIWDKISRKTSEGTKTVWYLCYTIFKVDVNNIMADYLDVIVMKSYTETMNKKDQ